MLKRLFSSHARSLSQEVVAKMAEDLTPLSAVEIMKEVEKLVLANEHRAVICKLVDAAIAKDSNVFSSELKTTVSIAQALSRDDCIIPNAQDVLGSSLSLAFRLKLDSKQTLTDMDVSLFTAINKLGKRSVMDVTESQANELA